MCVVTTECCTGCHYTTVYCNNTIPFKTQDGRTDCAALDGGVSCTPKLVHVFAAEDLVVCPVWCTPGSRVVIRTMRTSLSVLCGVHPGVVLSLGYNAGPTALLQPRSCARRVRACVRACVRAGRLVPRTVGWPRAWVSAHARVACFVPVLRFFFRARADTRWRRPWRRPQRAASRF